MKKTLEQALAAASPRIVPRPATLSGTLIHIAVLALWLLLFARAFFLHGALAWSTGIAYVVYDTLLLAFVTWKSLPLMRRATEREAAHGAGCEATHQATREAAHEAIREAAHEAACKAAHEVANGGACKAANAAANAAAHEAVHEAACKAANKVANGGACKAAHEAAHEAANEAAHEPDPDQRRFPSIGVIVAAHNEAAVLPVTLAALLRQTHAPAQIVIADDGSTDATRELLTERFGLREAADGVLSAPSASHPNLYWLRVPHGGKARALNAAIGVMSTDTVMTVDADTLLDDAATCAMRAAFAREPKLVAAAGILVPVCGKSATGRVFQWFQTYEYMRNFIARFAWMRADSLLLISGAFAAFRRDALVAVGGFDPQCLVEDYELIHRLRRYSVDHGLGWDVRVVGAARARTDAPDHLGSFLRQRRRWFAGFLQTQYWNRDMTGNPRYGTLGMLMLPIKAIDTMQPIYGLTAFALLLGFLFGGHGAIVVSIFSLIGIKTAIDLAFYLWSIHLYRRWTGERTGNSIGMAMLAALAEPFTFQIVRHVGAALGWLHFLRGGRVWGKQRRSGLVAERENRRVTGVTE